MKIFLYVSIKNHQWYPKFRSQSSIKKFGNIILPFIFGGNNITVLTKLMGLLKIKPQWWNVSMLQY